MHDGGINRILVIGGLFGVAYLFYRFCRWWEYRTIKPHIQGRKNGGNQ